MKTSPDRFDLREDPFRPTPDPRFLYYGTAYRSIYQSLEERLAEAAPVLLLIGAPGTGKTTLLQRLAESQSEAGLQVLFPSYTRLSFAELVQSCRELAGLEPASDGEDSDGRDFVTAIAQSGRPTIVLVDEAQVMGDRDLFGLCAMVADQAEGAGELKIVLAGQPELIGRLERSSCEPARSAAAAHLALSGLDAAEVGAYVSHRLETAGGAPDLFEPAAIARIAELSGGVPRLINRICSTGIFFAREEGESLVSLEVVEATIPLCLPEHAVDGDGEAEAEDDDLEPREAAVPSIASLLLRAEETRGQGAEESQVPPDEAAATTAPDQSATPESQLATADRSETPPIASPAPSEVSGSAGPVAPLRPERAMTASPETDGEDSAGEDLDAAAPVSSQVLLAGHRQRRQRNRYLSIAAGLVFGIVVGGTAMVAYLVRPEAPRQIWSFLAGGGGQGELAAPSIGQPADAGTSVAATESPVAAPGTAEAQESSPAADAPPADQPAKLAVVASPPVLEVADVAGLEDRPVPLRIAVSHPDVAEAGRYGVVLKGLPTGASLTAGRRQDDGSWTLASDELVGVSLNPPAEFSGPIALTALLQPPAGDGAPQAFTVALAGQADPPMLTVAPAAGRQGEAVPLAVQAGLLDDDGSETLVLTVLGLPAGGRLSGGKQDSDNAWRLEPFQLTDLALLAPADFAGAVDLTVIATAVESDGDRAEVSLSLPVQIDPVLTPPTLRVAAASGREDEAIPLTIEIMADDPRVRDLLQVAIKDLPAGAALSAGTAAPDGAWRLEAAQLEGLSLTPPADFSGRFDLKVEAAAADSPETRVQAAMKVTVAARADWPQLTVTQAEGFEDSAIPLKIAARPGDADGSETLQIMVAGVPEGGKLSAGKDEGDGRWRLAATELAELRFLPPAGFAGTVSLAVKAVAEEATGDSATAQAGLTVTVAAVADQPQITAEAVRGLEDTAIAMKIATAAQDPDGSETLSLVVTGLPAEAGLSAGTRQDDGSWKMAAADLTDLTLQPAADFSGILSLAATATAQEADGPAAQAQAEFTVTVLATADRPRLSVAPASGPEDTAIPLAITVAPAEGDADVSLGLSLTGLPAGAALSAGKPDDAGTWRLEAAELAGLTLMPPAHFSGPLALAVTAEARAEAGEPAAAAQDLMVVVAAEADKPTLTASPAQGREDEALSLDVAATLVDRDGSEELALLVAGLPEGARLSAGEPGDGDLWQLTPAALSDLRLLPPAHFSGSFVLSITAIAREATGETAESTASLPIALAAVADPPQLQVTGAEGREDTAIPLQLTGQLVDRDGSESLELAVSGLPEGATLSAGQAGDDGVWRLSAGQLDGLQLQLAEDFSGSFELDVKATARESGGDAATVTAKASLSVAGLADAPALIVAERHEGIEDAATALPIEAAATDRDGSESLTLEVSGLPEGWRLSAGSLEDDGRWRLSPDQLEGLMVQPADDASGEATLSLVARATEPAGDAAETTRTTTIAVAGRADAPLLVLSKAAGREDEALPLDIQVSLVDRDGSETLSVLLAGLPAGATLSAGRQDEAGVWQLAAEELSGLMLVPPAHFGGVLQLEITARAVEADGDAAESGAALTARIAGQADQPQLEVKPAAGRQGTAIPLSVAAALVDDDGSEVLAIELAGLPPGARLSKGQRDSDGIWRLAPDDLTGLAFEPPRDLSGTVVLTVVAIAGEVDGGSRAASAPLAIEIEAVSVKPALTVDNAAGREDQAIPLVIAAKPAEGRSDETLVVVVSGLPSAARLSAGTRLGSGAWRLSLAQLKGLTLLPAANFSGPLALTVTASTGDGAGEDATASTALAVDVEAEADAPALRVGDARGPSGEPLDLPIEAALSDLDGSESLVVEVGALPAGASLSAGQATAAGSWRVEAGQLSGLKLLPPADMSGPFQLAVLARSREADGPEAKTEALLPVLLEPVLHEPEPSVLVLGDEAVAAAAKLEVLATAESLSVPVERALPAPAEKPAEPRVVAQATESEVAAEWLVRGDELLKLGDVSAARLFYDLAVDEGSRRAITAMGKTYDPQVLRRMGVIGLPGEPAKARKWYQRAAEQGDAEAAELLKRLNGN